jgi:bacillolysin
LSNLSIKKMKQARILLTAIAVQFSVITLFGQNVKNWHSFANPNKSSFPAITQELRESLNLASTTELRLLRDQTDAHGNQHWTYEQWENGTRVEGARFIFHSRHDNDLRGNGRLVYGIQSTGKVNISFDNALRAGMDYMEAESFFWEHEKLESLVKDAKKTSSASFYPEEELVYFSSDFSQNGSKYKLAYKLDLYSYGPKGHKIIYVDATTGEILYEREGDHSENVEGTAETRYSGIQTMTTFKVSENEYILNDETRAAGVFTYNMQESENYDNAVEFVDEDNYWDADNLDMNNAAYDVHWGVQQTYDYYLTNYGYDSFDNNGSPLISYVHYGVNFFNAFWNGVWMTYGDGNNNPLTHIDVASHELTHGVTQYSADLIYSDESGALNESFSDIFGTAVEIYALGDEGDWLIGTENFTLRNMANPNQYGQPDTYGGNLWFDGAGVHTNSGVQNHWFYILSNGKTGTNDLGNGYQVDGIGIESAGAIAFQNLIYYLTPSSTYADAQQGALQAADDIFGECSYETTQTLKAWYAVGIGWSDFSRLVNVTEVSSPQSGCSLSNEETLSVMIRNDNIGCNSTFEAGTVLPIYYTLDGGDPIFDSITLADTFAPGDYLPFEFNEPVDLSQSGDRVLNVYLWDEEYNSVNQTAGFEIVIGNKVILETEQSIGFENTTLAPDSFAVINRENTDARISIYADNTGSRGFRMTGRDVNYWEFSPTELPADPAQNFSTNPEHIASICFCFDTQEMENALVQFDLKQTHSEYYFTQYGLDFTEQVSSMRVMINGEQVGDQYHPNTYEDDPYLTRYIDLNPFIGGEVNVCFESKNFLSSVDDPVSGSEGDNTYIDNVKLVSGTVGLSDQLAGEIRISPNPTQHFTRVQLRDVSNNGTLHLFNAQGKEIYVQQVFGNDQIDLDLSSLPAGVYTLKYQENEQFIVRQILKN